MNNEVILDSNVFILLLIGLIDPKRISRDKRTSIYTEEHFNYLNQVVSEYGVIITSPNIITEVDNILNRLPHEYKYKYNILIHEIMEKSIEKYYESKSFKDNWYFHNIGLTDAVILKMAQGSDLLISGDSELCDYAKSLNIKVLDFKEYANQDYN